MIVRKNKKHICEWNITVKLLLTAAAYNDKHKSELFSLEFCLRISHSVTVSADRLKLIIHHPWTRNVS